MRAARRFARWSWDQELIWYGYGLIGKVHARRGNVERNIVVSGAARSGTTWLMEIIGGITGYVTVNEPEMPVPKAKVKRYLGYDLKWRIYKDPEVDDPAFTEALYRILSGTYLRPSSLPRDVRTVIALLQGRPLIVKLIRANLFLPYLRGRFPRTKIVQIVRDPYAVIASQLTHPGLAWQRSQRIGPFNSPAIDSIVDLAPPLSLTRPEEVLAAHWCLEHAWLEKNVDRLADVHFVRYEELYNRPEKAFRNLTAYLEREWEERCLALADRRSRSVRPGSALVATADPTTGYKRNLTYEQQQRIGDVLAAFAYPFYPPE